MPTKFVRVRDTKTGVTTSVSDRRARQLADRGDAEILPDAPATDRAGNPLPASQPEPKAVRTTTAETTAAGAKSKEKSQ